MSSDGGSAGRRCSCSDESPYTRTRAVVEGGGAVAVVVVVDDDVDVDGVDIAGTPDYLQDGVG